MNTLAGRQAHTLAGIQAQRQADRQTDRQAGMKTGTQAGGQEDRHTGRHAGRKTGKQKGLQRDIVKQTLGRSCWQTHKPVNRRKEESYHDEHFRVLQWRWLDKAVPETTTTFVHREPSVMATSAVST